MDSSAVSIIVSRKAGCGFSFCSIIVSRQADSDFSFYDALYAACLVDKPKRVSVSCRIFQGDPRWDRKAWSKEAPTHHKTKAIRQRDLTSLHIHTEKHSGRAAPEIFHFFVCCPSRGAVSLAS